MNPRDYLHNIQAAIGQTPYLISTEIAFDEVGPDECYIHGILRLDSEFELHFAEYVVLSPRLNRLKYRYHLQRADGILVARWDNVAHHRHLSTFPHHRHDATGAAFASPPIDLPTVLKVIVPLLSP